VFGHESALASETGRRSAASLEFCPFHTPVELKKFQVQPDKWVITLATKDDWSGLAVITCKQQTLERRWERRIPADRSNREIITGCAVEGRLLELDRHRHVWLPWARHKPAALVNSVPSTVKVAPGGSVAIRVVTYVC